jgi:methylated-DNA-[protein]-cysteine S-methyltransferase
MIQLVTDTLSTPIGTITLIAGESKLYALDFSDFEPRMKTLLKRYHGEVTLTPAANPYGFTEQLQSYFAGNLSALDPITTAPCGTPFQKQVWQALRTIPAATTYSYGELARSIGSPKAVRAVGTANANNPVAIVVPCHRVIGSNGALTGYAGGMERKEWLLAHEKNSLRR